MSIYPGMYPLRAPNEKFKQFGYGKPVTPSKEETDGSPIGPAYLLMIQESVSIDSGWSEAEGGGSYGRMILSSLWTYDRGSWEKAILSIDANNRDPNRHGKPTVYLAYQVQNIVQVETTIRMI